jgi:bifunctional non-homologous end joining protein LigD
MSATKEALRIGNRVLQLSNLDKMFYPASGFTKRDVVEYYRAIAPVLVPHLKDRALTLKRYPDGVEAGFFYEKRCPPHRPDWVKTITMRRKRDGKDIAYCALNDQSSLVWAANLASIELHVSLARGKDVHRPTALVFDLDPDPDLGVIGAARAALWVKEELDELGLESHVKTSGSKGVQLFAPLNSAVTYEDTGPFALAVAGLVQEKRPDDIVTKQSKELRRGRVLIDWSQNADHKTTVAVYSLRAREQPTVSTPVTWDELRRAVRAEDPSKLTFLARDLLKRVERRGDLFGPVRTSRQKLPDLG